MNIDRIKEMAVSSVSSSGEAYQSLLLSAEKALALELKKSRREIQLLALKQGVVPERYIRNIGTIDVEGQILLLNATVAVVGAGGLGGTILQCLARMGVGRLVIVDGDVFSDHNLNRQVFAYEGNIGENKAMVASEQVQEINGSTEVTVHPEYLTSENINDILKSADVIVDALDNMSIRFLLERNAREKQIPFIHGAIGGYSGHVTTFLYDTNDVEGLAAIYGDEKEVSQTGVEVQTGNPAGTPLMVAAWQVHEVIKVITKAGPSLRNKLLYMDAEENIIQIIDLF